MREIVMEWKEFIVFSRVRLELILYDLISNVTHQIDLQQLI